MYFYFDVQLLIFLCIYASINCKGFLAPPGDLEIDKNQFLSSLTLNNSCFPVQSRTITVNFHQVDNIKKKVQLSSVYPPLTKGWALEHRVT